MKTIEYYQQHPIIDPHTCECLIVVKDLEHRFVASNSDIEIYSGMSPLELVGQQDKDMPWKENAANLVNQDLLVLCDDSDQTHHKIFFFKNIIFHSLTAVIYNLAGDKAGTMTTSTLLPSTFCQDYHSAYVNYTAIHYLLSGAETEILSLINRGYTRKEIVERSNIKLTTYKTHVKNLKLKLKVTSLNMLILNNTSPFIHLPANTT